MMQIFSLGICPLIGKEILIFIIPDIGIREVAGILGLGVENYRVASHLIGLIAHLNTINSDKLVCRGVVIATLRLHVALTLIYIATAMKLTHLGSGIEGAVIGIHHSIAIYDLDKLREDRSTAGITVVLRPIAIDIGGILVNQHIAEALKALI